MGTSVLPSFRFCGASCMLVPEAERGGVKGKTNKKLVKRKLTLVNYRK